MLSLLNILNFYESYDSDFLLIQLIHFFESKELPDSVNKLRLQGLPKVIHVPTLYFDLHLSAKLSNIGIELKPTELTDDILFEWGVIGCN